MRKKLFVFTSLLSLYLSMFGCGMRRIPVQELNKTHNLIIAPFRGTPAMIVAETGLLSLFTPLIYLGVEKGTRGSRQKIVTILNDNFSQWDPGDVIAQECSNLIEEFQTTRIENITIIDSRESRHSEKLRKEDPGRFSVKERSIYKWISAGGKWLESDSNRSFYKSQNSNADWVLEIFVSVLSIYVDKDKTTISTPMKLTNIQTGEVITSIGSLGSEFSFKTTLKLENISDFHSYIEDFRNGANQACSRILSKAGLITK